MDKDFKVFYQEDPKDSLAPTYHHLTTAQVSTNQEALNIPKEMVLEEKTPDLLALLTAHAGGDSSIVLIVPRPLTLALAHAAIANVTKRKGKGEKQLRALKKERSPILRNNCPPKRLVIQRPIKRNVLLLGPAKAPKESNILNRPYGILPLYSAQDTP